MKLLFDSYPDIAKKVRYKNAKIVIYGAGMIGTVLLPYLIDEYNLYENLLCYIDADERKWGNNICVGCKVYPVKSPEFLYHLPKDTIIFITNSNFSGVVSIMDNIEELDNIEAYIIPVLQAHNAHNNREKYHVRLTKEQCIPKKIHYCWFSGNPIPDYLLKCMESWKKYCPDYEIIRWDESNYDINKNLYMKQAYEAKKWGFVPDVARLDILYHHGGIYLDTDVELLRNIDDLLYQEAFVGVEKWGSINLGGCSGAIPHHPIIKQMLDYRIEERFCLQDGSLNQTTCGYYETKPLIMLGMKPNNMIQQIGSMTVYSSDFFHPYDYMSGETHITDNTFSIHHFNGGWLNRENIEERKKTQKLYQQVLRRMKGKNE